MRGVRWRIAGLLALATGLRFLDRQALPVLVSVISRDVPLSSQEFAQLQFYFLLAYGIMYAGGGRLVDMLGVRVGYALFITWWSGATLLHGFANSVWMLAAPVPGAGEGGGRVVPGA